MSEVAKAFIDSLLVVNPTERLTAAEALKYASRVWRVQSRCLLLASPASCTAARVSTSHPFIAHADMRTPAVGGHKKFSKHLFHAMRRFTSACKLKRLALGVRRNPRAPYAIAVAW